MVLILKKRKNNRILREIEKKIGKKYKSIDEIIPINKKSLQKIQEFKDTYNWHEELNINIHKNDLMFLASVLKGKYVQQGFMAYFKIGLNARNIINKLALKRFGKPENIKTLLDFASGYGRVTRFLVSDFEPQKIWVSDIKNKALDFQKKQFGVNTISSSYIPEEFKPKVKFDIIFVGSLFSHLPEDLFKRWIKTLYTTLHEDGIFIFSALDIEKHGTKNEKYFQFRETSEDIQFEDITDSIKHPDCYGVAYASDKFLKDVLTKETGIKENEYVCFKNAFGTTQDIYVVGKKAEIFKSGIDLSNYP